MLFLAISLACSLVVDARYDPVSVGHIENCSNFPSSSAEIATSTDIQYFTPATNGYSAGDATPARFDLAELREVPSSYFPAVNFIPTSCAQFHIPSPGAGPMSDDGIYSVNNLSSPRWMIFRYLEGSAALPPAVDFFPASYTVCPLPIPTADDMYSLHHSEANIIDDGISNSVNSSSYSRWATI
jgi:hypothetical protein